MLILNSSRLRLRPFQEADLAAFAAYRSIPEVARYQSWNTPYSLEQAQAFYEVLQREQPGTPGSHYQLAVERLDQPGMIGDCYLHVLASDPLQAEIGFSFAPQHQGQGYATEAVHRLLGYLFGELHLHRVTATCDVENIPSARLLERIGMRREGHFIENIWFKGAWGSEYLYAMLDSEWSKKTRGTQ